MSPKSCAFPVVDIVIKQISFTLPPDDHPRMITDLVGEEHDAPLKEVKVKSPKSVALPVDAIVINCMVF